MKFAASELFSGLHGKDGSNHALPPATTGLNLGAPEMFQLNELFKRNVGVKVFLAKNSG